MLVCKQREVSFDYLEYVGHYIISIFIDEDPFFFFLLINCPPFFIYHCLLSKMIRILKDVSEQYLPLILPIFKCFFFYSVMKSKCLFGRKKKSNMKNECLHKKSEEITDKIKVIEETHDLQGKRNWISLL